MNSFKWPREYPGAHWFDAEEERAVHDVIRKGAPFRHYGINTPRYVTAFESAACDYYGVRHALAVNSGTGALITAVTALGIGPGCEVIVPAFMWIATVTSVVNANAIPVLCEVDDSFTMNPKDLEKKITSRTKLIIPVHMAGAPCNMEALMSIAQRHSIPVLEDVAQCNGGSFMGKKLGTFGDIGMFSLQLNKNMTAGEGGLIVTNNDMLFDRIQAAHDTGCLWVNGTLQIPPPEARLWGSGRRMSELIGAVASVQIRKLPAVIEHMRGSHRRIKNLLSGVPGIGFRRLNDPEGYTGPFMIIILENEKKAVKATQHMREEGLDNISRVAEYGLHIYYNMLHLVQKVPLSPSGNPWNLEANRESIYEYSKGTCPKSDELFSRSILVPIPSILTDEQEREAASIIRAAVLST
jgi:8-amino-3,8-dideoxy-alpha-D-manno-octulosonate transaminase